METEREQVQCTGCKFLRERKQKNYSGKMGKLLIENDIAYVCGNKRFISEKINPGIYDENAGLFFGFVISTYFFDSKEKKHKPYALASRCPKSNEFWTSSMNMINCFHKTSTISKIKIDGIDCIGMNNGIIGVTFPTSKADLIITKFSLCSELSEKIKKHL